MAFKQSLSNSNYALGIQKQNLRPTTHQTDLRTTTINHSSHMSLIQSKKDPASLTFNMNKAVLNEKLSK